MNTNLRQLRHPGETADPTAGGGPAAYPDPAELPDAGGLPGLQTRSGLVPTWLLCATDVVQVRELRAQDRPAVLALHQRCSAETLRLRYLLPSGQLDVLVEWMFGGRSGRTLVAVVGTRGHERIVGLAHLVPTPTAGEAEVAFLIEDDWQGVGLGSGLLSLVVEVARADGWAALHADVALDNDRMVHMFRDRGWSLQVADGTYSLRCALDADPPAAPACAPTTQP